MIIYSNLIISLTDFLIKSNWYILSILLFSLSYCAGAYGFNDITFFLGLVSLVLYIFLRLISSDAKKIAIEFLEEVKES